jgi:hypothetical protein
MTRLQEYWGVGPKTAEVLREALEEEAAVEAIESADIRTLTEAGLSGGRATRIVRRAHGEAGMDLLATSDARDVYKSILDRAAEYAVTRHAADRIRVLTPLADRTTAEERVTEVSEARSSWAAMDGPTREAVLEAFEAYDGTAGERAAVEAALELADAGATEGVFTPLGELDREALRAVAVALGGLDGDRVRDGVDDRLDSLREQYEAADRLSTNPRSVIDDLGRAGDPDALQTAFVRHVTKETGIESARVREATPGEARDATDFVAGTLRTLVTDLEAAVTDREAKVRTDLRESVGAAREAVDAAVAAVDDAAVHVSLARFADAFDLRPPTFVDEPGVAVVNARNLDLVVAGGSVQPVTYAVGDHDLDGRTGPPVGDSVAVLTGANSGGKTTVLETLCQVTLLASMGLPVPVDRATVGPVDAVVFHRRHASFNAGVLESTLANIVPPLTTRERTLMLVDEFEAITEPGRAADLLHALVGLTVDQGALGVFVTHLAEDLAPLPEAARVDGIFAEGLSPDLELEVDYQPRFDTVGKSTPEFIVSRLLADAEDPAERVGYEALAEAVGESAVQRTLADVRWAEGDT